MSMLSIFGILLGCLYEQTVEWSAHGWFQHGDTRIFRYFERRHFRHHQEPRVHHALQPIGVCFPVIGVLLLPAALCLRFGSGLAEVGSGVVFGFLFCHIVLNLLHYEFHAPRERHVLPEFIHRTRYYKAVQRYHRWHHEGDERAHHVFGITNPWLDKFLHRVGVSDWMDRNYVRGLRAIERVLYRGSGPNGSGG